MMLWSLCQSVKYTSIEHQLPGGLLQSLEVPTWKSECIACDNVVGLWMTQQQHDSIWLVVDLLMMKSAHFI